MYREGAPGVFFIALIALLTAALLSTPMEVKAQGGSACVDCHSKTTPGIVADWQKGKMAQKGIQCYVCHGSEHHSANDTAKAKSPTPKMCETCHIQQVKQFQAGKHSLAWAAMKAMPMAVHQPSPVTGSEGFKGCSGCHKIG